MKTHLAIALLVLAVIGSTFDTSAQARGWDKPRDVSIEIVDDRGRELRQYPVAGGRHGSRAYVTAKRGRNYAIRVHNPSGQRVGLVIAVDGRNIISGEKSHLEVTERMYVLGPHESAEYDGWRTSRDRVNRFYFTDAADSYAEVFDDDSAMGVIAVAVFREKVHRVQEVAPPIRPRATAPRHGGKLPALGAEDAASEPGTGFGASEWSPSRRVHFEPESRPLAKHFIKYEWRRTLCEKGIIPCHRERPHNRFWPDDDDGFAPHPPGREPGWNRPYRY